MLVTFLDRGRTYAKDVLEWLKGVAWSEKARKKLIRIDISFQELNLYLLVGSKLALNFNHLPVIQLHRNSAYVFASDDNSRVYSFQQGGD